MFNHLVNLVFPQWCAGCNGTLLEREEYLCTSCRAELKITNLHKENPNNVLNKFFGKIPVEHAFSMFYFNPGGIIQRLLHKLKYDGHYDLGIWMGKVYGTEIVSSEWLNDIDVIVPIPLFKSKLKSRGYNQSEAFARGLGEVLQKEVDVTTLWRAKNTKTQTRKGRMERWHNVDEIFKVNFNSGIAGKNILLVDDVITSGATLESAGQVLMNAGTSKLYVATIATA